MLGWAYSMICTASGGTHPHAMFLSHIESQVTYMTASKQTMMMLVTEQGIV